MKIVFIENRQRTRGWVWMADFLKGKGCEIYWVVENHYYAPRRENVYIIPYPSIEEIQTAKEKGMPTEIYDYISFTDRNINHFGCKSADHYYYYYSQIKGYMLSIKPDIVIGECTQFHELLTISICREIGILYLQPSTCRYPVDRFSFYLYDTQEPYKGSGEEYTYEYALQTANNIANRSTVPSYMIKPAFSLKKWLEVQKEKLIHTYCYYSGERYCTPSPIRKRELNQHRDTLVKIWNQLADEKQWESHIDNKFVVMYPMQMQPEANLDVWGYPYKDQAATIKKIADQLYEDEILVVKPNPKAKYELTDELLSLVSARDNILIVPISTPMGVVFEKTNLVVVVTGTITMECIVSNKPVVTLANTMNNTQRNCPYLADLTKLRPYIQSAKNGKYEKLSDSERVAYINKIVKTSYKGNPYTLTNDIGMENALINILNL